MHLLTLTEQSRCRVLYCGSTNDHRDSLTFVQEVARFVTSCFFEKRKSIGRSEKSLNLATKLLNWQYCPHLYYSPLSLSVWLQQHTHFQTYTHVQEYLDHGQSEGGPPFTISDWFRPRYGPNVCLLLNHRKTFRVAETFSFLERLVAPLRN